MPPLDVRDRMARGMVAAWRARVEQLERGRVVERDGIVVMLSGLPDPSLSVALVAREPEDPFEAVRAADAVFVDGGGSLGIDLEVGRHPAVERALEHLGFGVLFTRPAMAIATQDVRQPRDLADVDVRIAGDDDLATLVEIEVDSFETDPTVAERMFPPLSHPPAGWRSYLTTFEGGPAAAAHLATSDGAIGIFGVGVKRAFRRRGIGEVTTATATLDSAVAFDADLAWLQSTDEGLPLYEHMGFETVAEWAVWIRR